ncbi:uncharacterized protein LOC143422054 [Xylocopa sonorina]|uniref:uncharacterized protein LOC143422054 n=1 Tax=Xylocopa sonorina TaxID=1818115 RepID=UPI00403AA6F2
MKPSEELRKMIIKLIHRNIYQCCTSHEFFHDFASGENGTGMEVFGAGTGARVIEEGSKRFYDLRSTDRSHTKDPKIKKKKEVNDDKGGKKRGRWELARTNGCAKLTMIYGDGWPIFHSINIALSVHQITRQRLGFSGAGPGTK